MGRCCCYDFTMFYPKGYVPVIESDEYQQGIIRTRRILEGISKKYCFQLEKGEKTGRYHLQGRFSLKMKDTCEATAVKLRELGWDDFRLSYTSEENRTNMFYVSKEETREDGPFDDTNEVFIPREVAKMTVLRPWQDALLAVLQSYNDRSIDVLVDVYGNSGKSAFTKYMMIKHDAKKLFYCNDYKDVMRMAYCVGEAPLYIIDLPRAIPKSSLKGLYSALEELKGGICFDDRNQFRYRIHKQNPRIIVFTNAMPDFSLLSVDRWKLWEINSKMKLKKMQVVREDWPDEDAYEAGIHMSSSDESLSEDILVSRDVSSSEGDSSSEGTEESPKRRTTKTKKDKRSDEVQTISKKKRKAKK